MPQRDRARLRASFDASFVAPAAAPPDARVDYVIVEAWREERYALRIEALVGIFPCPPVTALPTGAGADRRPSLLGVATLDGSLRAVHDLALLVRGDRARRPPAPRWLVVTRAEPSLALAVAAVVGGTRADTGTLAGDGPPDRLQTPLGPATVVDPAALWRSLAQAHPADTPAPGGRR